MIQKDILFLGRQKEELKKKRAYYELNSVSIYFRKTTCVEILDEIWNRNDEKKMNEDGEESFHNDKVILFWNMKP